MDADILDIPNIGARVFKRPGPRIRSAKTGAIVPPETFAKALIVVAALEHAVVDGARPESVICACGAVVRIAAAGPPPKFCVDCAKERMRKSRAKHRGANRDKERERDREKKRVERAENPGKQKGSRDKYREANREQLREKDRAYQAAKRAAARAPT